jgi:hypothetical protein
VITTDIQLWVSARNSLTNRVADGSRQEDDCHCTKGDETGHSLARLRQRFPQPTFDSYQTDAITFSYRFAARRARFLTADFGGIRGSNRWEAVLPPV